MAKKNQNLKDYELMVIVKALLPDDVRQKTLDTVKDTISKSGGNIASEDIWGKKYLSYDIQGHAEGYYVIYDIQLPPESLVEVDRVLSLQSELLRHMVITQDQRPAAKTAKKKASVIAFDRDIKDIDV